MSELTPAVHPETEQEYRLRKGIGAGWFKWRQDLGEASTAWVDTRDLGIEVIKMPPVTKPEEKSEFLEIPGRGSFVVLREAEYAYKSYLKEVTIAIPLIPKNEAEPDGGADTEPVNSGYEGAGGAGTGSGGMSGTPANDYEPVNPDGGYLHEYKGYPEICAIHEWLRGDGHVQFSTEPGYRYHAHIAGKIEFTKIGRNMMQAVIPFWCAPYRMSMSSTRLSWEAEDDNGINETFEVDGNVPTRPQMYVHRVGGDERETPKNITVKLRWTDPRTNELVKQEMTFHNMKKASVHALCNPMICMNADETEMWEEKVDGDYFWLYPGTNRIICEDKVEVIMHANWRWV